MRNQFLVILLIFAANLPTRAALSGNYIVSEKSIAPFNTIRTAIQYLTDEGADGSVTFTLTDPLYDEPGITIGLIPGLTTTNTLTIQAEDGKDVTFICAIMTIEKIEHIEFKGHINHKLNLVSNKLKQPVIDCYARKLKLEYCSILSEQEASADGLIIKDCDELELTNCSVDGFSHCMNIYASITSKIQMRYNQFGRAKRTGGILVRSNNDDNNQINSVLMEYNYFNLNSSANGFGIFSNNIVFKNNTYSIDPTYYPILYLSYMSANERIEFIQNSITYQPTIPNSGSLSAHCYFETKKCDVLNNSFSCHDFFAPWCIDRYVGVDAPVFKFSNPSNSPTRINVQNNVLEIKNTTDKWRGYINFYKSDDPSDETFKNAIISNNIYYAEGYPRINFNADIDFDKWRQNNPQFDASSQFIAPAFVSPTDLHLTQSNNLGIPIPEITTDIEGNPRDPLHPDAGAYEFKETTSTPTIAQDGQCQSTSIQFAIKDLGAGSWTISWDFGDGTTGSGLETQHVFNVNGNYTVTAVISGNRSYVISKKLEVNALPVKPVVKIKP